MFEYPLITTGPACVLGVRGIGALAIASNRRKDPSSGTQIMATMFWLVVVLLTYLAILAGFAVGTFETKTSWALRRKPHSNECEIEKGS
jgi:hypothetical protein